MAVKLADNIYANVGKVPSRDGLGKGLLELGETHPEVAVLCCDLKESTRVQWFEEKYPDRYFEVGVAEQNMAGIAAGMASEGKIPFIASYAVFSPGRNWDQIRVSICYSEYPVKIIGAHAGISVGPDGATHQALEDIAIMRVLPNMTVLSPCDWLEAKKATIHSLDIKGPVYFRLSRDKVPVITTEETPFKIGKAEVFRDGSDVTVVGSGQLVYEALVAAKQLEKEGISVRVVNNHTIKPIDKAAIIAAAKETGAIVTAEEHQIIGGLGSAVAEVLSENYPVPVKFVGVLDRFGESGPPDALLEKFGLKSRDIVQKIREVMKMRK
ncbi:MAG TPA: transketolase family protein [Candidatus Norongarragalinales archaeon]|nr:transketolase family protein [Candidatus Norongarragalinales archaeon]